MAERYEFKAPSWAGVFGSTMSDEELQALYDEVRGEEALWFWAWECPRGLWYCVDAEGKFGWLVCSGPVLTREW